MRFEKGHKEETRKRIVEVASARFRKDGVEAVGIAGLMADAGLTHGGFYAHFGSKEELVREAMAAAFESRRMISESEAGPVGLEALVRSYLRPSHRDTPEQGCAAASLVAEIARHEEATRAVFAERMGAITARIAKRLPQAMKEADRKAISVGIFGMMLGTLQLSRVVQDRAESDAVLESGVVSALKLAAACEV